MKKYSKKIDKCQISGKRDLKKIETPKTDEVIKEVVKKKLKKDLIKKKSTSIISKIKKLASKKSK